MQRARAFSYVAAGLFLLALSYHLGASTATAQAPGNPVVAAVQMNGLVVVTANGDVYYNPNNTGPAGYWVHNSNVFSAPTPAQQQSWGAVKSRYRAERGAAPQGR